MTPTAVDVVDISKRFRLYHEKYQSIKEKVLHGGRSPYEVFWALRDINFSVGEGETVGILGRNGSGKSTLLKCISGILQPTHGKVVVRGNLAALLELGAGFQPELSGRENIFLNASLLGLSTREVERRFDDIVAFAELEHFIDNQVKYYSSGMYVRLGFAVAVNVDPDVLVIDEVLAVGDENFQRKCLARIRQFQSDGRTILFVTHSPDLVRDICDRAVVLTGGEMLGVAGTAEAIRMYHDTLLGDSAAAEAVAEAADDPDRAVVRKVTITGVDLEHPGTGSRPYMLPGEPLTVRVAFEAIEPIDGLVFKIVIRDVQGNLIYGSGTDDLHQPFNAPIGAGLVDFSFDRVPLLEGAYDVSIEIVRNETVVDLSEEAARFEVMNPGHARGTVALAVRAEIRSPIAG